jgi:tetratricopeptide (TPR) repeat protein
VALLQQSGERWWLAMAHWARAMSYLLLGRFDEALDSVTWAQTIADRLQDVRLASQAASARGWIHATRGDWATAIEAGQRALELAPDEMSRAVAQGFLGNSYLEKGDAVAALALLEPAGETFRRLRFRQLEGWFTILQSYAHILTGDTARAAARLADGVEIVRGITFVPAILEARLVEGLLAQARQQPVEAEKALSETLGEAERLGTRFFAARVRLGLADLAGARGDDKARVHHLAVARAEFQALDAPVWVGLTPDP